MRQWQPFLLLSSYLEIFRASGWGKQNLPTHFCYFLTMRFPTCYNKIDTTTHVSKPCAVLTQRGKPILFCILIDQPCISWFVDLHFFSLDKEQIDMGSPNIATHPVSYTHACTHSTHTLVNLPLHLLICFLWPAARRRTWDHEDLKSRVKVLSEKQIPDTDTCDGEGSC